MTTRAAEIEAFLLRHATWIDTQTLLVAFQIEERELRQTGDVPGLCTEFAISGNKGFRHIDCCTAEEFADFTNRLRPHAIHTLMRIKKLRERFDARQLNPQLEMAL